MGQLTSKRAGVANGALPSVQFSSNEKGPTGYISHHFHGNSQQQDGNLQIPPTIVISDMDSRFDLSIFTF